jgi:hypothetical protein
MYQIKILPVSASYHELWGEIYLYKKNRHTALVTVYATVQIF